MAGLLSEDDERQIAERVAVAERNTAGEIVVTLAERSSTYARERMSVSFVMTLLIALLSYELVPALHVLWILCGQAPLMAFGWWLTGRASIVRVLVPEAGRREAVNARAKQLFVEQGVTETRQRSGVLLYLSEAEHRVELLADRGIHERVGAAAWQRTVDAVVSAIRTGQPREGLLHAVDAIGAALAEHFPPAADDINELPDAPRRV